MRGTFELAGEQAVDEVFGLILRRIDWMDEKGIRQWNVTGYAEAYPKTHYQEQLCSFRGIFVQASSLTEVKASQVGILTSAF